MNKYVITGFDQDTNAVHAHFEYNGHILDHTIFVDSLSDPVIIKNEVSAHYLKFTQDMDAVDATPVIPPDVSALIGQVETVS